MQFRKNRLAFSISYALLSGAFAVGGLSNAAYADDAQQAAPSSAPAADDAAIGVVTVTAQSRTQQSQEVPISMQVVTGDQINKLAANNLADMNGYIPGFSVSGDQPTQPGYSLRGIGVSDFGIGTDSPVGVYVDGVYTGKTGGALLNFNDTQRVEVLKGPQGTLFGRNSASGAISVVTKEPTNDFDNDSHVRIGQYGERYLDTMLNVPLSDTTALRFSFVDTKSDGWLTDAATGQHLNGTGDWGARTTLRWDAPGQTKVLLSWEHESLDQQARPEIGVIPASQWAPTPSPIVNPNTFLNPLTTPVYNDVAGDMESRVFDGVTLRVEHPMGWATFNSTTSYRHFNSGNLEGNDGNNQVTTYIDTNNIENNTTWQQEFKLSGKNNTVDWLTGASLFFETAHQTSQVDTNTDTLNTLFSNQPGGAPLYSIINSQLQGAGFPMNLFGDSWQESIINKNTSRSFALYGDAIWHVAQQVDFTTGVRYTHDYREFSWFTPPRVAPGLDAQLATLNQAGVLSQLAAGGLPVSLLTQNIEFNGATPPITESDTWTNVSPRAVLDYKLAPDIMLFASATKGYQAGGFSATSVPTPGNNQETQPETMVSYEAGIKSYFRPQHLLFNASVFSNKFSNLPTLALYGQPIPTYHLSTTNETAVGVDVDARWQPTHDLRLFVASEFIDQKYGNYIASVDNQNIDISNQPTGTPLWSAAGGIDYTQHGVWGGSMNYSIQHAYTGATRCNSASMLLGQGCESTPAFTLGTSTQRTDARIAWDAPAHDWGVAVYVNNVFNERYVSGLDTTSSQSGLGVLGATITPPRIAGVELHLSL